MNAAEPTRAPAGATAWCPSVGFLYEPADITQALNRNEAVLIVDADGEMHGVGAHERAPLNALLRVEADLAEVVVAIDDAMARSDDALVSRLLQIARDDDEHAQRLDELAARVTAIEDRLAGHDTGDAIELVAIKARLRRLEEGTR